MNDLDERKVMFSHFCDDKTDIKYVFAKYIPGTYFLAKSVFKSLYSQNK